MVETTKGQRRMRIGVIAALAALACLGTLAIRVPIPATTGYFNIGDIFVVLAGLWLGPFGGFIVGAVGPTLADAIGFPVFIPATFTTKGLEGFIVGLLAGGESASLGRKVTAAAAGAVVMVTGYFVFEALIYPMLGRVIPAFAVTDLAAAIVEVLPNIVQGVIGAAGGIALWRAVSGVKINP